MKWMGNACCVLLVVMLGCSHPSATDGEALAKSQCGSCHAFPSPTDLDRTTWDKFVLPRMGALMGILPLDSAGGQFIEPAALALGNTFILRKEASISKEEWVAIRRYFLDNAPAELPAANPSELEAVLPQFEVRFPDYFLSPPGTLLAQFNEAELLISDVHKHQVFSFDKTLELQRAAKLPSGMVAYTGFAEGEVATCIGSFSPTDDATGSLVFLPKAPGTQPFVLIDSLRRPVHTSIADLDADGRFDFIISEFGKWAGSLCWWKNDGQGGFERRWLRNMPGATRTEVADLNADSLPDVLALFAQGDEGVFAYINKGGGQFEEKRLLRFPPSFGSSSFKLFDYNGDGHPDILHTCGDLADFPPVHKPYHGIRIFQNNGKNEFKEVFFQPLQGAYGAVPADFDLDGDLDIAAISFFPDFQNAPQSGFVFFENQGSMRMKARTFPASHKGRWIVMDAADFDVDGDLDLVLGSMAFEVVPDRGEVANWVQDGIPFVVLVNHAQ